MSLLAHFINFGVKPAIKKMEKKTVIVTGASGNLGQVVVKKFLSEKYRVVGTIIANDPVVLEIQDLDFEKAVLDLIDENATGQFVQDVIRKYGQIDIAVLTVGGFAMGNIADTTSKDLMNQYKLNFQTAYHVARPVFQQMLKQKSGHIFLIGSKPGLDTKNGKGMVAYSLAKSLLFRLAELLNDEAEGLNVFTWVIVPSTIDTPQNRSSMPEADFTKWVTPEKLAEVIFSHCSCDTSVPKERVLKMYGDS